MTINTSHNRQTTYQELKKHNIVLNNQSAYYYTMVGKVVGKDQNADNAASVEKPIVHFYGGNGFAVGVYTPLLDALTAGFDVVSLSMRGGWQDKPAQKKLTREEDADILIDFLEKTQSAPVVGIGHSQGATATAIACAKRPDLFSKLYLIEPVTFTRQQTRLYSSLPRWFLHRHEPFKSCLKKQVVWKSVDAFYQDLRKKNTFRRMSDEHLQVYAENSLERTEKGLSLVFPPEQELANYFGVPFIDDALHKINTHKVDYQLIIGKPSIFVSTEVRKGWQKFIKDSNLTIYNDHGHLLPVEAPELCANKIIELYNQ